MKICPMTEADCEKDVYKRQVMQPYTMVKDHRTGEETGNVQSVMDGNLDSFMNAYLRWITTPKKA